MACLLLNPDAPFSGLGTQTRVYMCSTAIKEKGKYGACFSKFAQEVARVLANTCPFSKVHDDRLGKIVGLRQLEGLQNRYWLAQTEFKR